MIYRYVLLFSFVGFWVQALSLPEREYVFEMIYIILDYFFVLVLIFHMGFGLLMHLPKIRGREAGL